MDALRTTSFFKIYKLNFVLKLANSGPKPMLNLIIQIVDLVKLVEIIIDTKYKTNWKTLAILLKIYIFKLSK